MRCLLTPTRNLFFALLFIAGCLTTASAQSGGPYDLTRPTVAGGGAMSAGGPYVIVGTMAQHDAVVGSAGPYLFDGGFWPSELLTPQPCAADVSPHVKVELTRNRSKNADSHYQQVARLTNIGSSAIRGTISLVLDGLSQNITLLNASGVTSCALPVSPYLEVNVGRNGVFLPGERVTLVLRFDGKSRKGITYSTRVLAGNNR
jgi:hypothetical protein